MDETTTTSAVRVLDILSFLSERSQPVPAMTIARECRIPRSSVYHLLDVLRDRRFVTHIASEHLWGIGVGVDRLGSATARIDGMRRLARPLLRDLAERLGETVALDVLDGREVARVVHADPSGGPTERRVVTRAGSLLPAHLVASGQVLMMRFDAPRLRLAFAGRSLGEGSRQGSADRAAMQERVERARARGYGEEEGALDPTLGSLAVPVLDHNEAIVAAITCSFWPPSYGAVQRREIVGSMSDPATELSRRLGWRGPETPVTEDRSGSLAEAV